MRPAFESRDTVMFTLATSTAPDVAPIFAVYDEAATLVASYTAGSSGSTNFYALYTMPPVAGPFVAEWSALKTFSGSARSFVKRLPFAVVQTRP